MFNDSLTNEQRREREIFRARIRVVKTERKYFVLIQVEMFEKEVLSMIHQTCFSPITTQFYGIFENLPCRLNGYGNFPSATFSREIFRKFY